VVLTGPVATPGAAAKAAASNSFTKLPRSISPRFAATSPFPDPTSFISVSNGSPAFARPSISSARAFSRKSMWLTFTRSPTWCDAGFAS
jgi:hypothetical protein